MKFIIQIYEGEINGHGEKEGLLTEFQYEVEQEMLKHIHDLRNELREKGWMQRDSSPEVSQYGSIVLRKKSSSNQLEVNENQPSSCEKFHKQSYSRIC